MGQPTHTWQAGKGEGEGQASSYKAMEVGGSKAGGKSPQSQSVKPATQENRAQAGRLGVHVQLGKGVFGKAAASLASSFFFKGQGKGSPRHHPTHKAGYVAKAVLLFHIRTKGKGKAVPSRLPCLPKLPTRHKASPPKNTCMGKWKGARGFKNQRGEATKWRQGTAMQKWKNGKPIRAIMAGMKAGKAALGLGVPRSVPPQGSCKKATGWQGLGGGG